MTKSEFDNYVDKVLDRLNPVDYHSFTKIKLFCDYLWREISEDNNDDKRPSKRDS